MQTRRNLARFIALMALRHPKHQHRVSEVNAKLREAVKDLSPEQSVEFVAGDKTVLCSVEEILSGTRDDKNTIKTGFLRLMRQSVEDISEVLIQRRWGVVFAERPEFVRSDCPVVLERGISRKHAFGFRTPGTRILFPFCPTRLLVIDDSWPHDFAHYKLTKSDVFNLFLARDAVRFVYASDNLRELPAKIGAWRNKE